MGNESNRIRRRERRRRREPRKSPTLSIALVALCLGLPLVLLGGVHSSVQLVSMALFTVVLLAILVGQLRADEPLLLSPFFLFAAGFAILAALQLVPLPFSLLEILSPETARAVGSIDDAFARDHMFTPVSLDGAATAGAAVRWWALALAIAALGNLAARRRVRKATPWIVVALTSFLLVIGLVHALLDLERIFGVFQPQHSNAHSWFSAPFVSGNHAAHYLVLGAATAMVLLGGSSTGAKRALLLAIIGGALLGIAMAGSRGALVALVLAAFTWLVTSAKKVGTEHILSVATVLILALAVVFLLPEQGLSALIREPTANGTLDFGKLELQRLGVLAVSRFPATGIGADAFGSVQVGLGGIGTTVPLHASYTENDFLQLVVDFGVIGPVLVLLLSCWVWRYRPKGSKKRERPWLPVTVGFLSYCLFSFPTASLALTVGFMGLMATQLPQVAVKRGRKLALGLVVLASCATGLLAWSHSRAPGSLVDMAAAHSQARSQPLDGRGLFAVASDPILAEEPDVMQALLERAEALSGNDASLHYAMAEHAWQVGDASEAWRLYFVAAGRAPKARAEIHRWVARLPDGESVAHVCSVHPEWLEPVLDSLIRARRGADLLYAAGSLPTSAATLYYQVRGARFLGEEELAQMIAERLWSAPPAEAGDCLHHGLAHQALNENRTSVSVFEACLHQWEDDVDLLVHYLRSELEPAESLGADPEKVEAALSRLNVLSAADPTVRRDYWRYFTLFQARADACRAARVSRGNAADPLGRLRPLPSWALQACPALTDGP